MRPCNLPRRLGLLSSYFLSQVLCTSVIYEGPPPTVLAMILKDRMSENGIPHSYILPGPAMTNPFYAIHSSGGVPSVEREPAPALRQLAVWERRYCLIPRRYTVTHLEHVLVFSLIVIRAWSARRPDDYSLAALDLFLPMFEGEV